jgi:hypothetical protein
MEMCCGVLGASCYYCCHRLSCRRISLFDLVKSPPFVFVSFVLPSLIYVHFALSQCAGLQSRAEDAVVWDSVTEMNWRQQMANNFYNRRQLGDQELQLRYDRVRLTESLRLCLLEYEKVSRVDVRGSSGRTFIMYDFTDRARVKLSNDLTREFRSESDSRPHLRKCSGKLRQRKRIHEPTSQGTDINWR